MKKKGFTLIELLAVIVILAIIVTPVITGIIRSARDAADKRSAEAYVKAGENFFTSTLLSVENYALLGTNVIDKLDVSHNPATGSVIVDAEGNVEMAIVIRDKCYRKAKTASIGEITVDEDAKSYTITFDEKSETESGKDYINIWKTNECVYKLSGKEMAGQTYTVEDSFLGMMFSSDEENNYYGFKATITKNT